MEKNNNIEHFFFNAGHENKPDTVPECGSASATRSSSARTLCSGLHPSTERSAHGVASAI
jgi:hypothetical protein